MSDNVLDHIDEILISEETLQQRVRELGAEITRDYQGKDLLLVSILKGSMVFSADLMRHIALPIEVDFMAISSYGASTTSSGVVRIMNRQGLEACCCECYHVARSLYNEIVQCPDTN